VKRRRIPGREQERITLPQWDLEVLRQVEYHLPARLRPAGLDKAQVSRRDLGLEREIQLRDPPALAPFANEGADRPG
jgi:hypothetical protein